jgi:hypothetical protein
VNFRADTGAWQVARMTKEEEARLRVAHDGHCREILKDCVRAFPDRVELAVALFDKRADKFFTWSQAFLEEKVRSSRNGKNGNGGGGEHVRQA